MKEKKERDGASFSDDLIGHWHPSYSTLIGQFSLLRIIHSRLMMNRNFATGIRELGTMIRSFFIIFKNLLGR